MSIKISGINNTIADVTSGSLNVYTGHNISQSGYVSLVAESDPGDIIGSPTSRQLEASQDFRLRVGADNIFWDDTFNHAVLNTSVYQGITSTMTITIGSGFLNLNAGNATATGNVARIQTYRTFPLFGTYPLYINMWVRFNQALQANSVHEFGLGYATTTTSPTDAVIFRVDGTQLQGIINNNGAEQSVILNFNPTINRVYNYLIVIHNDKTEFWIDDVLYGTINTPIGLTSPMLSPSLPLLLRQYNNGTVSTAIQTGIGKINISQGDLANNRLWASAMVGNGQSTISGPHGSGSASQTANYVNSTVPVLAALSNTAAGYTSLGGQFAFLSIAGAETDYALFGYANQAGSAAIPGKNMMIRGVRIDTFVSGGNAPGQTLLQWGLGIGSTGVSLATTDSATAGTRAPRRLTLGIQSFPSNSIQGTVSNTIDTNFDVPLLVEPGTFFHIILKVPIGTTAAGSWIRGTSLINAYFE